MRRALRKKKIKNTLYYILIATGIFVFAASGSFIAWIFTIDIPDLSAFSERKIIQSTKIYDSTGTILLYDARGEIKRTVIPFEEIPRHVKNATVAIEDSNFYNHFGLNIESVFRAFFVNLLSGDIRQGGSTITQQLVKKALLSDERTFTRKIKEAILALRVERAFPKEEILNLYLNEIPYGAQSYGIEAASQTFFAKPARDLTLAEAAYLAALPKAPTYYSPYGQHRGELDARKNLVLNRMNELGFISAEETEKATTEEVIFISRADQGIKAPHFVMYVLEELINKYGEDKVENGGLKVITSLDWELQAKAEELTKKFVEEEEEQFKVANAGLAAVDPKTGRILVMVGSRDYFDIEREGNFNITTALRQPGSSIKPIVYAAALDKGYTDKTALFDLPTEFNTACNPDVREILPAEAEEAENQTDECYHPTNYDGIFRGPVTMREALAQSINVPSVKVLYLAGLTGALKMSKSLGITTLTDPSRYGLSLVLGGGEVKLLEMVGAYSVFANDGAHNPLAAIIKIEDSFGNLLFEHESLNEQILDINVARTISDMLSDNTARAPAFGASSLLYFPERNAAVKTGTTNDYRDAWVIGYTPNFTMGVWFGNNDNSPMEKKVAGFIAAPLWNAFFKEVFKTLAVEEFAPPEPKDVSKPVLKGEWRGSRAYFVDKVSGKLSTENTPQEFVEERVLTQVHSILHWIDKNDPRGQIPVNPDEDPQYRLWEFPVRKWAFEKGSVDQTEENIPKDFDDVHREEHRPQVSFIIEPPEKAEAGKSFSFTLAAEGRFAIKQIDVFANNKFVGTIRGEPYSFSVDLSKFDLTEYFTLSVKAYDAVGNSNTISRQIQVCFTGTEDCI